MRFFTPRPTFIPWLAEQSKKLGLPVIECGSGDGDLLREMANAKIVSMGIEARYGWLNEDIPLDLVNRVFPMEVERCRILTDLPAIVLVCRPCHGPWVDHINARRSLKSVFYYVGFKKNHRVDLGRARTRLALPDRVGMEKERIWEVLSR